MTKPETARRYGAALSMRTLKVASLLMVCLPVALSSGAAVATLPKDFTSVVIGPTDYGDIDIKTHADDLKIKFETKGAADIYNVTITVKPQGHSGWRRHPGPTLITVAKGTLPSSATRAPFQATILC